MAPIKAKAKRGAKVPVQASDDEEAGEEPVVSKKKKPFGPSFRREQFALPMLNRMVKNFGRASSDMVSLLTFMFTLYIAPMYLCVYILGPMHRHRPVWWHPLVCIASPVTWLLLHRCRPGPSLQGMFVPTLLIHTISLTRSL